MSIFTVYDCLLLVNIPNLCYREFYLRRPRGEIILGKETAEIEFVMDPCYMPEGLRKSGLKQRIFFKHHTEEQGVQHPPIVKTCAM